MGDKYDGALAAAGRPRMVDLSIAEAMHGLLLYESLVSCDDDGNIVLLRAVQNPNAGGLMMVALSPEKNETHLQEAIVSSQMTSMLRDESRCSKYSKAISKALEKRPGGVVLDIGSGTGLLAKMAARETAVHVDAIEMFENLAKLARQIISDNGLSQKITVYACSSQDMSSRDSVLPSSASDPLYDASGGDSANEPSIAHTMNMSMMTPARADILVTEIFDSALLGECCLSSIKHAHEHLLKPNALVVPAKATVYGVVLTSEFLARFYNFPSDFPLYRSSKEAQCVGTNIGLPIHFDALKEGEDFDYISKSFSLFTFDFSRTGIISSQSRKKSVNVQRTNAGRADVIMTWWELDLSGDGTIVFSTKSGSEKWQDHWLPVVYPLDKAAVPANEDLIPITAEHNEMNFSFAYGMNKSTERYCRCGHHAASKSPYRIFQLGDMPRLTSLRSRIKRCLERVSGTRTSNFRDTIKCLDVSDGGVCSALAVSLDVNSKVTALSIEEDDELSSFVFNKVAENVKHGDNQGRFAFEPLSAVIERQLIEKRDDGHWKPFDVILSEPYTRAMSAYPVSTLGNLMVQIRAASAIGSSEFVTVPGFARMYVQLLLFSPNTIQHSFETGREVQGFDYSRFDTLCEQKDWVARERRVSLPLFQYKYTAVGEKHCVDKIDLSKAGSWDKKKTSDVKIAEGASAEMIAIWVEYDNEECSRVQRYETVWLTDGEKRDVKRCGGLNVQSQFSSTSGNWDIRFGRLDVGGVSSE